MAGLLGGSAGREFVLKIIADITDARKGMDQIGNDSRTMKDKLVGIGKSVAVGLATTAVAAFGVAAVNAAADADDAMDSVNAIYGDSAKIINDFAKGAADSMGMSTTAYQTMVSKTGAALQDLGVDQETAANSTNELAQRAADMAVAFGTDTPTALAAMTAGLQGQTRGLKQFGINISSAEVEARAMAKGYVDASGKVTDAGKAIASQELILESTAKYQGLWADNSKDLGNQQEILRAKMENLKVTVGNQLLPVVLKLVSTFQPIMQFLSEQAKYLVPLAGIFLGIVGGIKAVTVAQQAWSAAQAVWSAATKVASGVQMAFNAVMAANPIGLIVIAITAVIAAIVLLYTKVDWFRDAVDAAIDGIVAAWNWLLDIIKSVFNWVKDNWPLLLAIITGPFGAAVAIVVKNWDTIKAAVLGVFNWIRDNWQLLLGIITGPFGAAVAIVIRHWDSIKQAVSNAIAAIKSVVGTIVSAITTPFANAWTGIKNVWANAGNYFRNIVNGITGAFSGIANALSAPFRTAFNAIKSLWNSTVGGFKFTVPSWIPGIGGKGFSIPRMASGGIVTKPTIALIGEAGPEAVVPLGSGNVGLGNITINVYALTANAEVGRKVYEALREYERVNGRVA